MALYHTVKQGEHITGIATKYGFRYYATLWEHPLNKELKALRKNPNVLFPGDRIFIPDKQVKKEARHTNQKHRFKVLGQSIRLQIVVRDFDNQPVVNADCCLDVEGSVYQLRTNGFGLIEKTIPKTATSGKLSIPILGVEVPVKIGHLDPVDEQSGLRARLMNLGYYPHHIAADDKSQLLHAIEEFQCDYKLAVTGQFDETTKAKLKQVHGC